MKSLLLFAIGVKLGLCYPSTDGSKLESEVPALVQYGDAVICRVRNCICICTAFFCVGEVLTDDVYRGRQRNASQEIEGNWPTAQLLAATGSAWLVFSFPPFPPVWRLFYWPGRPASMRWAVISYIAPFSHSLLKWESLYIFFQQWKSILQSKLYESTWVMCTGVGADTPRLC